MTKQELDEIRVRFIDNFGCPKNLVGLSLAPWVFQLQKDARKLLQEVTELQKEAKKKARAR